jgi:hypothetical protein
MQELSPSETTTYDPPGGKTVYAKTRQKNPLAGSLGDLAAYRKQRLRCATLFNLLGTFFTIALTGIVTLRRVLLERILLVWALSAFVRRVFLGLVHRSGGLRLLLEVFFSFVSHELLLYVGS